MRMMMDDADGWSSTHIHTHIQTHTLMQALRLDEGEKRFGGLHGIN